MSNSGSHKLTRLISAHAIDPAGSDDLPSFCLAYVNTQINQRLVVFSQTALDLTECAGVRS